MQSITIIGRRWFNPREGNSYFSASILVDGREVHQLPCEYGYGDAYLDAAGKWLDESGTLPSRLGRIAGNPMSLWRYCEVRGIELYTTVAQVRRKRDL